MKADTGMTNDASNPILTAFEEWHWWPEDAEIVSTSRYLLSVSPEGSPRATVHQSLPVFASDPHALIAEVLAHVRRKGVRSVVWWVAPWTLPDDMGEILTVHGGRIVEEVELLEWNLGQGPAPHLPAVRAGVAVQVERVRGDVALAVAQQLAAEVFGDPPPSPAQLTRWTEEIERDESAGNGRHLQFLARVEGEAAGTAAVSVSGAFARMWGAATLPPYRGTGVYSTLVLARLVAAHRYGARHALVKARTGTSGPILQRTGFTRHGVERAYELPLEPGGGE